ncbi:hypothetical protein COO91_11193 (plasmid) [Nostoc flagelliforme CCNUN1]|uniref:Uncharacterized protein n=1 Tax=Nostoc flagelliforme CCNUN1 TaxID=2038116 RepID=A0A2K8TB57_9NOSO|nr:hypothetical protein COO91_11193 [Nostoc flagelliforme CCNUN1]
MKSVGAARLRHRFIVGSDPGESDPKYTKPGFLTSEKKRLG